MIRSLDAQRMPRAVYLWEIRSEVFLKSNSGSAADPIKLDLFVTKLLRSVSLYWADAFRNVANYNKNKIVIIIFHKEYSVTCCRGRGRAGQGRAGQGRAGQGTVLPFRYEGGDIRLKVDECQEQISVLKSMRIIFYCFSIQTKKRITYIYIIYRGHHYMFRCICIIFRKSCPF